jgi:hypothetical protein
MPKRMPSRQRSSQFFDRFRVPGGRDHDRLKPADRDRIGPLPGLSHFLLKGVVAHEDIGRHSQANLGQKGFAAAQIELDVDALGLLEGVRNFFHRLRHGVSAQHVNPTARLALPAAREDQEQNAQPHAPDIWPGGLHNELPS